MTTQREAEIIEIIKSKGECSSKEVFDNISSFKEIFINQFEFAVNTYF